MNIIVHISRGFVGLLFIVSGLIKLNDPLGFSFKLEEYFSEAVLNLPFLVPLALALSVVIVITEVVLGVLLLIGYQTKWVLYSLLGMIVFFTFLTFYSAYFNKVTDCGCFGDAIKLTPWESFIKDIVLLVFIVFLYLKQEFIQPLVELKVQQIISGVTLLLCALMAYHVLNHLPMVDFRPYKIGADINENMIVPEDAPKAIYRYNWEFEVDGENTVISTNGSYPEVDGTFTGNVETELVQKGYEPPIHDFSIEKNGIDITPEILDEEKVLLVISYDLYLSKEKGLSQLKTLIDQAISEGFRVIGMSASSEEETEMINSKYDTSIDWYFTDQTTLKTIVRSNPAVVRVENGVITDKLHFNDFNHLFK